MAKPTKIHPVILPHPAFAQPATPEGGSAVTPDSASAEVTAAWDYLRTSLGKSVPYNVNRAQAARRRFNQAIR